MERGTGKSHSKQIVKHFLLDFEIRVAFKSKRASMFPEYGIFNINYIFNLDIIMHHAYMNVYNVFLTSNK